MTVEFHFPTLNDEINEFQAFQRTLCGIENYTARMGGGGGGGGGGTTNVRRWDSVAELNNAANQVCIAKHIYPEEVL